MKNDNGRVASLERVPIHIKTGLLMIQLNLSHGYDVILICKGKTRHAKQKSHNGMKRCIKLWLFH